ncbi:8188_t:CDS:2 [Ambispora gerdemannii]|uniref:8188_t:CDS:1 n=1 Tax=Ambispora gerdemannii TaxID=144530 RepID=A0A9N9DW89_9GLOM|nr:8188_t:CDS:2 [Ambispora gerdemannii]
MSRIKKDKKNQVIVVPTTQKSVPKTKPVKTPTKSRPVPSKQNTLAYYDCLIDQIANSSNPKTKITQLAHHCKCNKGQVAQAQQEHKQQLVQQLAKNYKAFGQSLGHYLQADIIGITNVISLAIFAGYTVRLRLRQIVLEKKNGKEQHQIDELKQEIEKLKKNG